MEMVESLFTVLACVGFEHKFGSWLSENRSFEKVGHPLYLSSHRFHGFYFTSRRRRKKEGQNEDREKREKSGSCGVTGDARGCQSVISLAGSSLGNAVV